MFPNGVPIDSRSSVSNGSFRKCGQIVAVSLTQGGPTPMFLHENMYTIMLIGNVTEAVTTNVCTEADKRIFSSMQKDIKEHQDIILDHGYTGIVEESKKDEIIATVKGEVHSKTKI